MFPVAQNPLPPQSLPPGIRQIGRIYPACNNAKSDHIAAEEHLAAWIEQNREHAAETDARLAEAALPHDLSATVRIAEWAYEQTEQAHGQVWVANRVFTHLGPEWRRLLVA